MKRQRNREQHAAWTALATATVLCLALAPAAVAQEVAQVRAASAGIDFQPLVEHGGLVLTVSGPDGFHHRAEFGAGESPSFSIFDRAGGALPDGSYNYELRVTPTNVQRREAFEANRLESRGGSPKGIPSLVQSGSFALVNGSVVAGGEVERGARPAGGGSALTTKDQVISDDLIVQGSICVGFDCVNNENFGFDTIRLKENNTRIKFEDTSVGSFPSNDWQLTANDSSSGGQNRFSIEDVTGGRVPFTIEAASTTNSIYVDSTGRVGFRTSTPVLDIHVATSNTPGLRLEQTTAGGFTAQTWDVAGNEANFFVRDVTGGSRLPFRIRPGAPTSSVEIAASGNVGLGTASPTDELSVKSAGSANDVMVVVASGTSTHNIFRVRENSNNSGLFSVFDSTGTENIRFTGDAGGRVAIGCSAPGADLDIADAAGAACSGAATRSFVNAGDTNFTASSSRTLKENIVPVSVQDILGRIKEIPVYRYDFIEGPKGKLGLMAEDFHQVFSKGPETLLNGQEVQMAMWLAIQELVRQNEELASQNHVLRSEIIGIKKILE